MILKKTSVVLEETNPKWKDMYLDEEKELKNLLKEHIIDIEHVGSTSIPGLAAKPVIDMMVVVNKLSDVENFKHLFRPEDGYFVRDDNGEQDEYFVTRDTLNNIYYFIHIVENNSSRYYNFVKFKSYLLNHPEYIKKYEDLKKELALKYSEDRKSYTANKNDFIQNVLKLYDEEHNNSK